MRISNKFLISFLFLSYAAIFSRAFKQGIKPYTLKAKTNILQKQVSIFKLKLAKKITQDANFPENQYRSKSNWNKLADFWNKLINFLQQIKILPTREIDAIDQNGSTELIRATVNQDEKKVLELLKDRANANIQNNNGETALICAAKNGYTNITKRLIKTSDLNIQDSYLRTALIWSVENRHKNIATMLITRGAALNKQDKYGDTAIMIASRNGETDLIQLLLDRNADANKVNKLGNSALNLAYENNHKESAEILRAQDATLEINSKLASYIFKAIIVSAFVWSFNKDLNAMGGKIQKGLAKFAATQDQEDAKKLISVLTEKLLVLVSSILGSFGAEFFINKKIRKENQDLFSNKEQVKAEFFDALEDAEDWEIENSNGDGQDGVGLGGKDTQEI